MPLSSYKFANINNWLLTFTLAMTVLLSLLVIYNRMLLVESRELLAEVLVLNLTARLLIEKRGAVTEAETWMCDSENRIAQYAVKRMVVHSELPWVVEQQKKQFRDLGRDDAATLRLYVAPHPGMWSKIEGRLYLECPWSREKWTLWGKPHLRKEYLQEATRTDIPEKLKP